MTKYELSLTRDYVPSWTIVDAMRELFQNALDQQIQVEDNTMFWEYHPEIESFHIGNKLSILEPKTLLLGSSTKTEDKSTIGQFGEGYKIATLVLTRLGKKVTFFNYGAREVWKARFSKSKKYGAEILVFEVDKKFPWAAVPNNNLTIVVEGITPEEQMEIWNSNLHLQSAYSYWGTPMGKILTDPRHKGMMFVNGLYICTSKEFGYGYNFNPEHVTLDRDRKLITDFNLSWTTSQMWASFQDDDDSWDYDAIDAAGQLLEKNMPDVKYFKTANNYSNRPRYKAVLDQAHDSFKTDYGENAVPVSYQHELETVPSTHKAVLVPEVYKEAITSSPKYVAPARVVKKSLRDRVEEWMGKWDEKIDDEAYAELRSILDEELPF